MMYFSKEELELIRYMLYRLTMEGNGNTLTNGVFTKVTHQMETME